MCRFHLRLSVRCSVSLVEIKHKSGTLLRGWLYFPQHNSRPLRGIALSFVEKIKLPLRDGSSVAPAGASEIPLGPRYPRLKTVGYFLTPLGGA
jgi:hypothetical protein